MRHISYSIIREPEVPAYGEEIGAPEQAVAWARHVLPDDGQEHFYVGLLNSQNRLIGTVRAATGTLTATLVHPLTVFGPALREGAAHVVLAHCHPSGLATPSKEDLTLTRQLVEGARLLGLAIHDHVIIGSGTDRSYSLAANGEM